jgi:hypothetical protein
MSSNTGFWPVHRVVGGIYSVSGIGAMLGMAVNVPFCDLVIVTGSKF